MIEERKNNPIVQLSILNIVDSSQVSIKQMHGIKKGESSKLDYVSVRPIIKVPVSGKKIHISACNISEIIIDPICKYVTVERTVVYVDAKPNVLESILTET